MAPSALPIGESSLEFDYSGELVNEWLYQSTKETRRWWTFKVHGLKRLYRQVMIRGFV